MCLSLSPALSLNGFHGDSCAQQKRLQGWIHTISPLTTWTYTHVHMGKILYAYTLIPIVVKHMQIACEQFFLSLCCTQCMQSLTLTLPFHSNRLIACGHKHRWLFTTTHMAVRLEVQWLICPKFDHCSSTTGSSWLWLVKLLCVPRYIPSDGADVSDPTLCFYADVGTWNHRSFLYHYGCVWFFQRYTFKEIKIRPFSDP